MAAIPRRLWTVVGLALVAMYALAVISGGADRVAGRTGHIWLDRIGIAQTGPGTDRARVAAAMQSSDGDAARSSARAALIADPLDHRHSQLLGTLAAIAGEDTLAVRSLRHAARLGWRNPATQAFWYAEAVRENAWGDAALRLDALLRVGRLREEEASLFYSMENAPAGRSALLGYIASQKPAWAQNYLVPQSQNAEALLRQRAAWLSQSETILGCATVRPMARELVVRDRRGEAERLWRHQCPADGEIPILADPGFAWLGRDKAEGFPVTWEVHRSGDVSLRQSGEGLQISNRSAVTRLVLSQAVALPASRWRVVGATDNDGKLAFSLDCDGRPERPARNAGDELTSTLCEQQVFGIWLRPGATATLHHIAIQPVTPD